MRLEEAEFGRWTHAFLINFTVALAFIWIGLRFSLGIVSLGASILASILSSWQLLAFCAVSLLGISLYPAFHSFGEGGFVQRRLSNIAGLTGFIFGGLTAALISFEGVDF